MVESKNTELREDLLDKINSIDPVASHILKDFYKDILEESSKRELTALEQKLAAQLSATYSDSKDPESVVNELLDEVYEILKEGTQDDDSEGKLYSVLEKVIFINAREKVFKKFFDDIEEVICSVLQLDYSKNIEGLAINDREVNIFNYAAAALNMIVDKMSTACLSTKVVDYVTEQLGKVMIVVTDTSNKVRYVNSHVEELLGKDKVELIDNDIHDVLDLSTLDNCEGGRVDFIGVDGQYSLVRAVAEVEDSSEIAEMVYLIRS